MPASLPVSRPDSDSLLRVEVSRNQLVFQLSQGRARPVTWTETYALRQLRIAAPGCRIAVSYDLLGRAVTREWGDGAHEAFTRDEQGRLSSWTRPDGAIHLYSYDGKDLVAERGPDGAWLRSIDSAGRLIRLERPDGSCVDYDYDEAGRRIRRRDGAVETTYRYDAAGRLIAAGAVEMAYDSRGLRAAVHAHRGIRYEQRDAWGRLQSITDASGRGLHTFVWWRNRLVARVDGPTGGPAAEIYLCDPLGSALAVLRDGAVERAGTPPYGSVPTGLRPTLYGHVGDPETGLIHFGARDLDPEVGLFLTPDPWRGHADDPGRWERRNPRVLALLAEIPRSGIHPYALCQFDPVGRSDLDGHYTNGWAIIRTLLLAPTWGFPLTSVSLFFFMPFNLYFELIGDLIFLIGMIFGARKVPWSNHHIWKLLGAATSGRQGMFSLALNGLLPRWVSSSLDISADRAVTVGNVVWINREELALLDARRVLDVWDIGGPPGAGGVPGGGATAFNADSTKRSVIAVTATKGGHRRVHVSPWVRGFGNAVGAPPGAAPAAPAVPDQQIQDRPNPAAARFSRGSIHLFTALPADFPAPASESDTSVKLEVAEYLGTPATATAELTDPVQFAVELPKASNVVVGNGLQLSKTGANPVLVRVADLTKDEDFETVFFAHPLPAAMTKDLTVRGVRDAGGSFAGWQAGGALTSLELALAAGAGPPPLAKDGLVRVQASPAAGGAAPEDTTFARVTAVRCTLALKPALPAAPDGPVDGTVVLLLRAEGSPFNGTADPAKPAELKLAPGHPAVANGWLLSAKIEATNEVVYARVTNVAGDVLTVAPPLVPGLTLAGGPKPVRLQRYVDTKPDTDKGTEKGGPAGDAITVEVSRADLFRKRSLIHFEVGGTHHVREIDGVAKVTLDVSNECRGAAPFTVFPAELNPNLKLTGVKVAARRRFLKYKTGTAPPGFGVYPNAVLAVRPSSAARAGQPTEAAFFLQAGAAAGLHPTYKATWKPQTVDLDQFFVLDTDLPIEEETSGGATALHWRIDRDARVNLGPPPLEFVVDEYAASGATRADDAARGLRVMAHPAEALVPADPRVHDTHRRALIEHELHHSVQNSRWGPLMGALPLPGLLLDFNELKAAAGDEQPNWLKELIASGSGLDQPGLGWATLFSIGGIMEIVWKYVFLLPFYPDESIRRSIAGANFSDWQRIFNPVNSLLFSGLPEVDPRADAGDRWPLALLRLLTNATDLRAWTPFIGFVPALLPDSARSFLEQGASRASGDLYSTILTAGDRFNFHTHTFFVGDSKDANLSKPLGDIIRLMAYGEDRGDRLLQIDRGAEPGSPLRYQRSPEPTERFTTGLGAPDDDVVWMTPGASFAAPGAVALFHADLYDWKSAPGATVTLEGPAPAAGGARPTTTFLEAHQGDELRPRPRSLVPIPPRVNRAAGFYFIPATPGQYDITAFCIYSMLIRRGGLTPAKRADFEKQIARTETVTVTIGGEVRLGEDDVPWQAPVPVGPAATVAAAVAALPKLKRFVTETSLLTVRNQDSARFVADVEPPGAPGLVTVSPQAGRGWTLKASHVFAAGATVSRVRIYRIIERNDPAFDLTYDHPDREPVASLAGVRSYLTDPLWIPVRDFQLEVEDLPPLPDATRAATTASDTAYTLELPIPVVGQAAFSFKRDRAVVDLAREKLSGRPVAFPRGERWKLGPLPDIIEDPVAYDVSVTFGVPPASVVRPFTLTFNPVVRLVNAVPGGPLEAKKDHPLALNIVGGTAPYRVDAPGLPPNTTATVTPGGTVLVTVNQPPAADTRVVLTVSDHNDKRGRRAITVKTGP